MRRISAAMILVASLGLAAPASAFDQVVKTFFGGVAIDGYDATAYWVHSEPREGDDAHEVDWNDAVWRFASAEDAAAFKADPLRYAPAYGGRCANAMSKGEDVDSDPEVWMIEGDRLFLFYAKSGRARWLSGDRKALIAEADKNWAQLSKDG